MIIFQTVSKIYSKEIGTRPHTALDSLSFSVQKGETLGLIGANGAGKSTSIRLLMDFIRPDRGTMRIPRNPATHSTGIRSVIPVESGQVVGAKRRCFLMSN